MADDPSSTTILHFNRNMEIVINLISEVITEEDIKNNSIRKKLLELTHHYMDLACENFQDRACLDLSMCMQEVLVAHRHIAYDFINQKPILFDNFNDYFTRLIESIADLYPLRTKKVIIENIPILRKKEAEYAESLAS